jgi:hypothetical protein
MFERYGVLIGIILVCAVTALAVLLARQAARSVAQFREEHHESFTERRRP